MIQLSSDEKTAQDPMSNTTLENEETQDSQRTKMVFEIRPSAIHGRSICGIASSFYCCKSDTKIHDLADWFVKNPSFKAVGVIDDINQPIGVITRTELFNTLSTQFGRELYYGKVVNVIARKTKNFNYNENIFSVAAEISQYIMDPEPTYFLLTAVEGSFAGIFSTHDVLVYLSEITNKDIALASRIQTCVVPHKNNIMHESFSFMASTKMAKGIGGDFCTIKNYQDGRWFFALCDVSGKGMSAALMSVAIGGMVHLYDFSKGLIGFVHAINTYFFKTFEAEQFATGVFFDFDEYSGKMEICDAGHSMLYLFRDGKIKKFRTKNDNPPLGIRQNYEFTTGSFSLKVGDVLIACTDGVDEQRNTSGVRYGVERFLQTILKTASSGIDKITKTALSEIEAFRGNQPQDDDISMLLFEYHGFSGNHESEGTKIS